MNGVFAALTGVGSLSRRPLAFLLSMRAAPPGGSALSPDDPINGAPRRIVPLPELDFTLVPLLE
jgi:hypothetical protein